jgi:hypothetical protein
MTAIRCAAPVLVLLLSATEARAERPRSGFVEAGAFAGWHVFSADNELGAFEGNGRALEIDDAFSFGVRLGYAWTSWLALEGELALHPTEVDGPLEDDLEDEAFVFGWRGHAVISFLEGSRLRPFVLAGGGALTTTASDSGALLADTDALLHAGAGVKIHVRESWGVRVEARAMFPPTTDGGGFAVDWEAFVGIYGEFTGPPPPPPAPPAPPAPPPEGAK